MALDLSSSKKLDDNPISPLAANSTSGASTSEIIVDDGSDTALDLTTGNGNSSSNKQRNGDILAMSRKRSHPWPDHLRSDSPFDQSPPPPVFDDSEDLNGESNCNENGSFICQYCCRDFSQQPVIYQKWGAIQVCTHLPLFFSLKL